jgi:undecaprenyl-diphosphatase
MNTNIRTYGLIASLLIFLLLAFINSDDGLMYFDQEIRNFALSKSNSKIESIMLLISKPGTLSGILTTSLVLSISAFLRFNWKSALIPLTIIPFVAINEVTKLLIRRPRPDDLQDFGFPSSHAFETMLVMGFIWFIFNKKNEPNKNSNRIILGIMLLWCIVIGISRIYLDRHWFTDVIGGYALGIPIIFFIGLLFSKAK